MSKHTIWTINFYFQECLLCILRSQLEKKHSGLKWKNQDFYVPETGIKISPWSLLMAHVNLYCHFLGWSIAGSLGPLVSWDQNFHPIVDVFLFFLPRPSFGEEKKRIFWPTCVHLAKGWKVNLLDGAPKWPPFNLQNKKSCLKEIKHNRCRV